MINLELNTVNGQEYFKIPPLKAPILFSHKEDRVPKIKKLIKKFPNHRGLFQIEKRFNKLWLEKLENGSVHSRLLIRNVDWLDP